MENFNNQNNIKIILQCLGCCCTTQSQCNLFVSTRMLWWCVM